MKTISLLLIAAASALAQLPAQVDVHVYDMTTTPGLQWAQALGNTLNQGANQMALGLAAGTAAHLRQQEIDLERERFEWEKQRAVDRLPSYREVHSEEANWRINQDAIDAYKAGREAHPDFDSLEPAMAVVAQVLRPDWRRITIKEYVECLYAIAKNANFAESARGKLALAQPSAKP